MTDSSVHNASLTSADSPSARGPLRVAVVGHTNTGKTSLLRTLTRDTGFGEVSARPGTTRHVEGARLTVGAELIVEFYDTPGMEDAIALLELLDAQASGGGRRLDGPGRIQQFLQSPAASGRFEQEAKVLRQMLASDAAVYVIDARDPVLAKYRDELEILANCAVPILPLLNFTRDPRADERGWREALARLGLHVLVSFDTVAPVRGGERVLYEKLATFLDQRGESLLRLTASQSREAQQRRIAAARLVAELLIDVAACRVRVESADTPSALDATVTELNRRVRAREQSCVDALLGLYRFSRQDVATTHLPFSEGGWRDDLFDPRTLTAFGISLGGGAAAGAAAGLGVDLMLGGTTLGAAAAIGALMGGGLQTIRRFGRRIGRQALSAVTGSRYLRIDDHILQILATRQLFLVQALQARGHAAIEQIAVEDISAPALWQGRLPAVLQKVREHPDWSGLYHVTSWDSGRQRSLDEATRVLEQALADMVSR
ncbi:MAG: GTPase/DUF3482 domain-containing protein [Gammaproteobacteria bacterium]|nr:GTPase/DUF3482 domain-containing protein [Gammaproteobacteria bacterium]